MTHSPAHVIATLLVREELFLWPTVNAEWPLYLAHMPDGNGAPDDAAACMDTEGMRDGRLLATGQLLLRHGVQVLVRAGTYAEGWQKAQAVQACLEAVNRESVSVGNSTYLIQTASQTSPVVPMGLEPGTTRRWLFSLNYLVHVQETE